MPEPRNRKPGLEQRPRPDHLLQPALPHIAGTCGDMSHVSPSRAFPTCSLCQVSRPDLNHVPGSPLWQQNSHSDDMHQDPTLLLPWYSWNIIQRNSGVNPARSRFYESIQGHQGRLKNCLVHGKERRITIWKCILCCKNVTGHLTNVSDNCDSTKQSWFNVAFLNLTEVQLRSRVPAQHTTTTTTTTALLQTNPPIWI